MQWLGIKHRSTTAFHPQANALVERFHRTMKNALRARCADSNWVDHLPIILLTLRNLPVGDSGISPSQYVFGAPTRLPGCFTVPVSDNPTSSDFVTALRNIVHSLQPPPHEWHGNHGQHTFRDSKLDSASHVYIRADARHGLEPCYKGPFPVLKRSEKFFTLDIDGKQDTVSCDRLKPAILPDLSKAFSSQDDKKFSTTKSGRLIVRPSRYD